jgi:hypothetical protein
MRSYRFKLRTIMVGVAFLSLILTIIVQAIRLRSAAVELQRARARLARVDPEAAWAQAIEDSHRFRSSPQNQRRWAAQMDYERHRMSLQHAPH